MEKGLKATIKVKFEQNQNWKCPVKTSQFDDKNIFRQYKYNLN